MISLLRNIVFFLILVLLLGVILIPSEASFVFLPNGETIVMTMGNRLVYWNYKTDKN